MKRVVGVIGAAMLVLSLHAPARGIELRVGATANYGTSNNFGVGPRLELDLGEYVPGLRLAGDYHKFFDSHIYSDLDKLAVESTAWDAGFHVLYDLTTVAIADGATLYAGAGVLYADRKYDHWIGAAAETITADDLFTRYGKLQKLQDKYKSDSGTSFALTVGSTFNTGWTVIPFVEARYTIGVVDEFMLAAGVLFSTGAGAK